MSGFGMFKRSRHSWRLPNEKYIAKGGRTFYKYKFNKKTCIRHNGKLIEYSRSEHGWKCRCGFVQKRGVVYPIGDYK